MISFLRAVLRNRPAAFFIGCWFLGLLTGTLFAAGADESLFSLMRAVAKCRVSIVALLLAAVLPFLIAAYAVNSYRYAVLYCLALVKGITFSFCGSIAMLAFASAGWLVRPMLQFTQIIICTVFCWFGLHRLGRSAVTGNDLAVCIGISTFAVIIDCSLVSPFLVSLM